MTFYCSLAKVIIVVGIFRAAYVRAVQSIFYVIRNVCKLKGLKRVIWRNVIQRKVEKGPWEGGGEQARARKPFFISRETVARDFPYTLEPYRSPRSERASRSTALFIVSRRRSGRRYIISPWMCASRRPMSTFTKRFFATTSKSTRGFIPFARALWRPRKIKAF